MREWCHQNGELGIFCHLCPQDANFDKSRFVGVKSLSEEVPAHCWRKTIRVWIESTGMSKEQFHFICITSSSKTTQLSAKKRPSWIRIPYGFPQIFDPMQSFPRHIKVKLSKIKDKWIILKEAGATNTPMYKKLLIRQLVVSQQKPYKPGDNEIMHSIAERQAGTQDTLPGKGVHQKWRWVKDFLWYLKAEEFYQH